MKSVLVLVLLVALAGCKSGEPEATKDDFSKRPAPPGWHGPSGAPTGATPPAVGGK